MIDVVPGQTPALNPGRKPLFNRFSPSRRTARMALALGMALPLAAMGQAAAPSAPSAAPAPQIITVPVPQAPAAGGAAQGPNWNNGTQGRTTQNGTTIQNGIRTSTDGMGGRDANSTTKLVDTPTEFQLMVNQTVGYDLPIFGANLFTAPPSTFAPLDDVQVTPDYVIGAGDEIRISATGQLNQQGTFTVDRAGTISIPEVGTMTVAGLRFSDLKPFLRQQIGRIYRNFELNVTLGQLHSIQIYVLGQARQPGAFTVSSLSTLVNALFASGGVLPQGSLRRIELRRGGRLLTTIDLYDLLLRGDKTKDVELQPGDIIFVPTVGPQVAIVGSITNPAIYELKDETTLGELVKLANGLTSTASNSTARVESIDNHTRRAIEDVSITNNAFTLHGGEIITVAPISDQFKDAVTLRGNVATPGRYKWKPGMRISDLIPSREALITRNYYRTLNAQGTPAAPYTPAQGHIAVSTPPAAGTTGSNSEAPTPTASNASSASGGGTTVGDALTQNNGTFSQQTDVILNAPDVDLSYAVIERLDTVNLTTVLIPFNLGAVLDHTDASQNLELVSGDIVTIFSKSDIRVPQTQQTRFVRLEGEFIAAGVYSVRPGETLRSLITRAGGLTPDAYLFASEFTRQSVRRVEQQRVREYADSLEQQIGTQSAQDVSGSLNVAQAAQSEQIGVDSARQVVARLRATQPTGRLVLKLKPDAHGIESLPDLPLEDGDRFIVPRQPTSVSVAGQVYNAGAFLFEPSLQVRNYLRDAGGPDRTADHKRIFVIRADGSVVSQQYSNVEKATVLPGDTIVVPPELTRRNALRDFITVSTSLGNIALPLAILALTLKQ